MNNVNTKKKPLPKLPNYKGITLLTKQIRWENCRNRLREEAMEHL